MSPWHECGGAAESRRGEVAPIFREIEQKDGIIYGEQSMSAV